MGSQLKLPYQSMQILSKPATNHLAVTKKINPRMDIITKTLATIIVPSLIFKLSPKKRPNATNAANNPNP